MGKRKATVSSSRLARLESMEIEKRILAGAPKVRSVKTARNKLPGIYSAKK